MLKNSNWSHQLSLNYLYNTISQVTHLPQQALNYKTANYTTCMKLAKMQFKYFCLSVA